MTKTISLINHKGGVGKTTSTVNIGAGLNRLGKKVLLIDLDPQANLTINLGLEPTEEKNIYQAFHGAYPLPVKNIKNGLDAVCSTLDLSVAEMELFTEPGREYILKNLIKPVEKQYDYILIDCPPALGFLTLNALTASQLAIIPVELSNFAIVGMSKLFDVMGKVRDRINPDLNDFRILMTRTDKRKRVHKDIAELLQNKYPDKTFKTEISSNVKIEESQLDRKDIFEYDAQSSGASDYMAVCHEILTIK
jgi:chromosome partitioning protein